MDGTNGALRSGFAEYLFGEGTNFKAQEYLGAHRVSGQTFVFRVWAPNAECVFVCGDFNGWGDSVPMEKNQTGIWAVMIDIPGFGEGSKYKFIVESGGRRVFKCDPYARCSEVPAGACSIFSEPDYEWGDADYMERLRGNAGYYLHDRIPPKPMNIYEVHLGSWKRGAGNSYLSYHELADELSVYVSAMGYTHIELLPVAEHPYDGSWGYQVCGYFAPTSRFGSPRDFKYFVDTMHKNGIGVILDWVPAHFPKDEHGLMDFDGGHLYEYSGDDRIENPGWGTRCFDVARNQVRSFLISNALYWLGEFHADGLRVDAVASMLYLDFGRKPGEWNPNPDGSNINHGAVDFFKKLNGAVSRYFPDRCMIAEESTAYPDVTKKHGLGFTYKWNMGWMNDTLEYISTDAVFRSSIHNKLTFSLAYAFSENYVLPVSHDEVVHLKRNLIDKCPGHYNAKFATVRAYLTYMMTHPGKKLLFMGCEFGQFREWNFETSLEWFLLDYEKHSMLRDFVADLNHVYRDTPSLYEKDCEYDGFSWIFPNNRDDNIIVYERIAIDGRRSVVAINFSGNDRPEYRIPLSEGGSYIELLNSDETRYGGFGYVNEKHLKTRRTPAGGNELVVRLPAFGAAIFDKKR